MKQEDIFGSNGATFSTDKKYRYALWRIWNEGKTLVMFIGLNPSTATENENDPTVRRVIKFAYDWGFGGCYMMNLFAYVTPYPKELRYDDDYEVNKQKLIETARACSAVIFAWGAWPEAKERGAEVIAMFPGALVLGQNKDGSPKHPLYLPKDTQPVPMEIR